MNYLADPQVLRSIYRVYYLSAVEKRCAGHRDEWLLSHIEGWHLISEAPMPTWRCYVARVDEPS